jgi:hypothetical protein
MAGCGDDVGDGAIYEAISNRVGKARESATDHGLISFSGQFLCMK